MKKICIFSAFYPPHQGGVERYVKNIAHELNLRGYEVIVVTSNVPNSNDLEYDNGVKVFRLPVYLLINGRYPLPKFGSKYMQLLKQIESENCDLYLTNMRIYPHTFIGIKLAKKHNRPIYLIEHVSGFFDLKNPVLNHIAKFYENFVSKLIRNKVDKFFAVSKAASEHLLNFDILSNGELYNGIDSKYPFANEYDPYFEFGIDRKSILVCGAGRILEEKGYGILCKAFSQINGDSHLIIAGSGPELDRLTKKYDEYTNIHFAGKLQHSQLMDLLKHCNIVVVPSYYPEGLPTLILEAGLSQCAVIATDIGGTRELIISGETGILTEPGSVTEIRNALNILINGADQRAELAKSLNYKVLNKFTWTKIVDKLENYL